MVFKRVEIGCSLDSARTASPGEVRTRPVMTLAASNWTFLSLLAEIVDSQGAQAAAAYPNI